MLQDLRAISNLRRKVRLARSFSEESSDLSHEAHERQARANVIQVSEIIMGVKSMKMPYVPLVNATRRKTTIEVYRIISAVIARCANPLPTRRS